jgi:hypothetical protein
MSEENLEVQEEDVEAIEEGKASFGDPSETPEPTTPKGGTNHKRSADKTAGEKAPIMQGSSRLTKAGMIADMVKKMHGMAAGDVKAAYKSFSSASGEMTPVMQGNSKISEGHKITTNDIDINEDMDAIFGETDLTEEFKTKAVEIFETAVVAKVNDIVEEVVSLQEAELLTIKEEMVEKIDSYLDYVVEKWMEENEIAIDSGIRSEISEDFIMGLKGLFEEHWIDIPEDKIDVVEELTMQNEELKENLDQTLNENIDLLNENETYKKAIIIDDISEGLAMVDREKFFDLAEAVEFEDDDSYTSRLEALKESYFGSGSDDTIASEEPDTSSDDAVELEEEVINEATDPDVARYASSLSRFL